MGRVFVFGMLGVVVLGLIVAAGFLLPLVGRWWKKMLK